MNLTIRGLQEAQNNNAKRMAAVSPSGTFGKVVKQATIEAQRYTILITHVITGSLRASHRMEMRSSQGRIYIDPGAVNPRTGQRPADYGPIEEARGGSHAFYHRTKTEEGPRIAARARAELMRALR